MAIKESVVEQHTFRVTGRVGTNTYSNEINCTLDEARSRASACETKQRTDGIFERGLAKIEKWDGHKYVQVSRYEGKKR